MKKIIPQIAFFFLTFFSSFAQDNLYFVATISPELIENANAVYRLREQNINVVSKKSMVISTKDVVTILNEKGLSNASTYEYFDKSIRIKSIEAVVLNAFGKEIKKIRRKDFVENSVSKGSLITDGMMLYMNYTPTEYPFTIIYQSEVESPNTAFIPSWNPIQGSYESIEKATFSIFASPELGFKYKEFNTNGIQNITKEEKPNGVRFTASSLAALKDEEYSPSYQNYVPHVLFGLGSFNLEGVEGTASNWKDFGSWYYSSLLAGTDEIPLETQAKIKALVGTEKDPIKVAKIVYKYVQNKTRYISIQLGIGGWKPMLAKDVDRLGYGDCKALTNYTRSLLNIVGVPSYYTVVYGDTKKRNLHEDFVSMQGNHVILSIPVGDKMYWLECTSQTSPFGFQGDFTDNRLALIVKPDGGTIIKTHEYSVDENSQITRGNYVINETGAIQGKALIKSRGTQYDNKSANAYKSLEELHKFYKSYFSHINNLRLSKVNVADDKENIEFSEEVTLDASEYAKKSGTRLIFSLNAYNPLTSVPQRYRKRTNPFEIERGFYDYDEITIDLPSGFIIEAKPENFEVKNQFGSFKTEYVAVSESQVLYKRTFQSNSGYFEKEDYEKFREFREQIMKNDNAKMVIVKN